MQQQYRGQARSAVAPQQTVQGQVPVHQQMPQAQGYERQHTLHNNGTLAWQQQQAANIWNYAAAWQAMGGYPYPYQQQYSCGNQPHQGYYPFPQQLGLGNLSQPSMVQGSGQPWTEEQGAISESRGNRAVDIRNSMSEMEIEARKQLGKRKMRAEGRRRGDQTQAEDKFDQEEDEEESEEDGSEQGDSEFRDIPMGIETAARGERQVEERYLLPFVLALHGQDVFVLGLKNSDGMIFLPAAPLVHIPSHEEIVYVVRRLYEDKFKFRVFPKEMMPKQSVEVQGGKRIRYLIPLVDARILTEYWYGMQNVGMDFILLSSFTTGDPAILSMVMVEPGIPAHFLRRLDEKLLKRRNLNSLYLADYLRERWPEHLQLVTSSEGRIQHGHASSERGQT
ncbi:hypothetical protein CBR_g44446 [Chara braunii]|uniref:Uncharacterized protein n=1 Tax=Chara braunii TaxID=69332 RepID=A0A388LXL1_CHABU|nr:hypothetical protein CBR_g44446 [Chara braunii]|eukprot:GBG86991.1 hypothetical protein CBR_g44446 [Chara braunii]